MQATGTHSYVPESSIHQTNLNWQESNSAGVAGDNLLAHPSLVQELEAAQRQVAVLTAHRDEARTLAEYLRGLVLSERAFLRRTDLEQEAKVLALTMNWELGIWSEHPNLERPVEDKAISQAWLSVNTGIPTSHISGWQQSMVDAKWYRRRYELRREWDEEKKRWVPKKIAFWAPPEGLEWERTWGAPDGPPALANPKRRVREAEKAKKRRDKVARLIAAICPGCGGDDVEVVCRFCGEITHVDDMPEGGRPDGASD